MNQAVAPGGDYGGAGRIPHDPTEAQISEAHRRNLGVRARPIVDEHHLGAGDCLTGPTARRSSVPSRVPELVGATLEDVDQLLIDVTAPIVPDVHHDPARVPELVDLVLEAPERGLVHRTDVDVSDTAVRLPFDELAILRHPLLVLDVVE